MNRVSLWSIRTTSSGKFDRIKREGRPLRGAIREDRNAEQFGWVVRVVERPWTFLRYSSESIRDIAERMK